MDNGTINIKTEEYKGKTNLAVYLVDIQLVVKNTVSETEFVRKINF